MASTTAKTNNVQSAILEVMKDVGYVEKTGKMSMGRSSYTFTEERELIAALRPSMIKNGLIMVPKGVTEGTETYAEYLRNDKPWRIYRAQFCFELIHPESNTSLDVYAPGEGADNGDKASNKASTGALKYALRQTFLIETGDDPDNTSSEAVAGTTSKNATPRTVKKAAPKKEVDEDVLKKALAYKVPAGMPHAGDTLEKAMTQKPTGVMVISFIAGVEPSGDGNTMYEPQTEEDKKVQAAAKYVYDYSDEFKKLLENYNSSVN
jgi:hypothetical protein